MPASPFHGWFLCLFTFLFFLRVAGHLLVVRRAPPWLPEERFWRSGLIPYAQLLLSQLFILVLQFALCHALLTGEGIFAPRNPALGKALLVFSALYALAMVFRFLLQRNLRPDLGPFGHAIPIVAHLLLAAFLFTYATHHHPLLPNLAWSEPMTMLTDYLVALLALPFGIATFHANAPHRHHSRALWACAFLTLALGALAGGTYHGFAWSPNLGASLWSLTALSLNLTALLMTATLVFTTCPAKGKLRKTFLALATAKFLAFATLGVLLADFLLLLADYGSAMLLLLLASLLPAQRKTRPEANWLVAAILLSFLAGAAQASGLRLHTHFNHNDLFHLLQLPALLLFLRAGLLMEDQPEKA